MLTSLLRAAHLAELLSFGRIAKDRLGVIERLKTMIDEQNTDEKSLQELITDAPWLINPEWAPVTENRAFSSLRSALERYFEAKTGVKIALGNFSETGKRPDFILFNQEGCIQILEIKRPNHKLTNDEMDRIVAYHQIMENFLQDAQNSDFKKHFPDFHITIVCEDQNLTRSFLQVFKEMRESGKLTHLSWSGFLMRAQQAHQDFLTESERQRQSVSSPTSEAER